MAFNTRPILPANLRLTVAVFDSSSVVPVDGTLAEDGRADRVHGSDPALIALDAAACASAEGWGFPSTKARLLGEVASVCAPLDALACGRDVSALTPELVDEYLGARRGAGYVNYRSLNSMRPLLDYLEPLGVLPQLGPVALGR